MKQRSFFDSLRFKITWPMLFIGLLPVLSVGIIAYISINGALNNTRTSVNNTYIQLERDVIGVNVADAALTTAIDIDQFVFSHVEDARAWTLTPTVMETARIGYVQSEELGLPDIPIDELEEMMSSGKSLCSNPTADSYLKNLQANAEGHFGEIFITDAHGYNVASTNLTSDFVQSNEAWWQVAWEKGVYIGDVEYDASSNIWGSDICWRIDDPDTGQYLGVLKTVLNIDMLQEIADLHAALVQDGSISIITRDGRLLAETATRHDPERIMNVEADVDIDVSIAGMTALSAVETKGFELAEGIILGYSRSAQGDNYQPLHGFSGFELAVVVEQPERVAFAALVGLNDIEGDLEDSRSTIGATVIGMAIFVSAVAIVLSLMLSLGITLPVSRLRDAAERVSVGNLDVEIDVSGEDETGEACRSFSRVVDSLRELTVVCESVAAGDYTRSTELRSENDRLGQALNQMMTNLRETSDDSQRKISYLNNIPASVVVTDQDMNVRFVNRAALNFFGIEDVECTGLKCFELVNSDKCGEERCPVYVMMKDGGVQTTDIVAGLAGGEVPIRATCAALHDDNGIMTGAIEFFDDIRNEMSVVEIAERIAVGDYSAEVPRRFEDDRLSIALEEMLMGLKSTVAQANLIAQRDFVSVINPRSENDSLALAFRNMTETLLEVTDTAAAISSGDFSCPVAVKGDGDILGKAVNQMLADLQILTEGKETQLWFAEGRSGLNEAMSGELDIETLAKQVTAYLARGLEATMAAMYVLEADGRFHLAGSYAFTRRKGNRITFAIGEGLVGQAAREGETIIFSDISPDYVMTGASPDEAAPRHIVEAPFFLSGEIKGVVELGLSEELPEEKMAFLKDAMRSVAIAVNSAQTRVLMNRLLDESQNLSQSLRAQQQELAAANEELSEKNKSQQLQAIDISRKNDALEALYMDIEHQAEELAQASRYKSEFLANMSHELRTPLNSLLILAQDLAANRKGNLTEDQLESTDIIYKSGNDLLLLINEILDLARIESGKMPVNIDSVCLSDVVDDIKTTFSHVVESKGLTLDITVSGDVPKTIKTDPQKLNQVLRNLLSNALKFTESGVISVNFFMPVFGESLLHDGQEPWQSIAIAVTDTGIGIPADRQKDVFEAFQQADGSTSREYGGTGLGLTISREIAMLLGGDLVLVSREGRGSTFTLFLAVDLQMVRLETGGEAVVSRQRKVAKLETPTLERALHIDFKDDRENINDGDKVILIIEDDLAFARVLYNFCRENNYKCIHAGDGRTGIRMAQEYCPAAIILDIHLPEIDGCGVLEALKENQNIRHIPVHIMSVETENVDAFRKGAMGFLSKPIGIEDIQGAFARIGSVLEKDVKDLLLVDDDEDVRRQIVKLIGNCDVKVTESSSGERALNELKTGVFDCVILDLKLPDISGFEVLNRMAEADHTAIPPVIIYTGQDLTTEEKQQLQRYARSIIVKDAKSRERLLDETALFLHREISKLPVSKKKMIERLHNKEIAFKGKKVLIVDDDMRNIFALSKSMESLGMDIYKSSNGQNALEILQTTPDIDLVLMDIMMPVMDGYEAMRRIREQDRFINLPILALTAKAMAGDREQCIQAGANDYIPKPVDIDRLLSMMQVWLYR